MNQTDKDIFWMKEAIKQAEIAGRAGEVPVGAVIVQGDQLLASAGNMPISGEDPTAHAEIQALRKASKKLNNYRLTGTTLYVTLEPCVMCAGAMVHARVTRIVYGATDPKTGALDSLYHIGRDGNLNHEFTVTRGIEEEKCAEILKSFFSARRKRGG